MAYSEADTKAKLITPKLVQQQKMKNQFDLKSSILDHALHRKL